MLNLKQFLIGIILGHLILREGFCNQFWYVDDGDSVTKTFEEAQDACLFYNMTLPVLETREDYHDLWNFISTSELKKDLWLGIQWNNSGFYQWLNGNILGIQNWATSEPTPQPGQRCVYADGDKKWLTTLCSSSKNVICFYNDGGYSGPPNQYLTTADFLTAYKICRDTDGSLPVIKTTDDLKNLSSTTYEGFWLGLIDNKDQFMWITGEYLGFYAWKDDERGILIHAHENTTFPFVTLHAPEVDRSRFYFCQHKTTKRDYFGLWSDNYYRLVERNAITLVSPRSQVIVRRGAHCAVACSRDAGCFKYSVDGTVCKTFGNIDYVVYEGGTTLYEKRRVSQKLDL